MADDAQPVDVVDNHRRVAAGEFGRSAVDVHNLNLAAADGHSMSLTGPELQSLLQNGGVYSPIFALRYLVDKTAIIL